MRIATPAVLALALLLGAVPARAQAISTQALFEKYNLLGTFSVDCTKPASSTNSYTVFRPLDAGRVQSDVMIGPTERLRAGVIDSTTGLGPNELAISGFSQELGRSNFVYRVEAKRFRVIEATRENGEKLVADGRLVQSGREMPWMNKCG